MAEALTGDQLEHGVANAIAARDFQAAIDILRVLVSVDPRRAQQVYDEIQVGLRIAKRSRMAGEA